VSITTPEVDFDFDLDAARREATGRDSLTFKYAGGAYQLPVEMPLDVLDPFLARDFNLVGLIREFTSPQKVKDPETGDLVNEDWTKTLERVLFTREDLPAEVLDAIHGAFSLLFGADDYARFRAARPSAQDYIRLVTSLSAKYGVSLGEAFASPSSSTEDGGATSKETSESTPESTPAPSGDAQVSEPASSESAG